MFTASVTVTKAHEWKTWADLSFWVHPRSPAGTMRTEIDDAQLQEFAFSDNVGLTRPVAGASRRELP